MIENHHILNGTKGLSEGGPADALSAHVLAFAPLARLKRVKKRQFLYLPGDPSEAVFLVHAGRIKISSSTRLGREVTLSILQPGELFGEVEALDGTPRETAAEALEDATLGVIPREDFARHLRTHPDLALELSKLIGARLRALQSRVQDLVFRDVPERLAHLLLELAPGDAGSAPSPGRLPGPLTHQEMANLVGCARETVTTILGHFREQGLIRMEGRSILLRNRDGLARLVA